MNDRVFYEYQNLVIGDIITWLLPNGNWYQEKILSKNYDDDGKLISMEVEKGWFTGVN